MSRIGYVYKLCCDGINDFYIGSSFDMKDRKINHKSRCNNANSKYYNLKLYQYIRANGGFENWKYEILVEKEFENKRDLEIKEQECIKLLNPLLNSKSAYQTEEDLKLQRKRYSAKNSTTKINCACGRTTDKTNKATHEKSNHHKKYITNNINNITNNITNLHIHNI
jgi:hypothetical protein